MNKIKIEKFHELSLMLDGEKAEVIFVTADSIVFKTDIKHIKNDQYHCVVRVLDKLCDITICPISVEGATVEAKVITSCEVYRQFIQEYFHAELSGMNLRKIPEQKIKKCPEGVPHWYYGNTEHEIYFIVAENKIQSFQISYNGEVVTYNEDGINLGSLWESEMDDRILHKGSHLVTEKSKFSKETMECLSRFIEICPEMDKSYKSQILQLVDTRFKKDWV